MKIKLNKKNKKTKIIIGIISLVFFGIVMYNVINKTQSNVMFINFEEIQTKLDKGDDFNLIISKEGCSYCDSLKEGLSSTATSMNIGKIYIFDYKKDESKDIVPKLNDIFPDLDFVPYICHVENGKIEKYSGELINKDIYLWLENN